MRSRDQLIQSVKYSLIQIFELGDRDEMSWKHLGHGVAGILAHDSWEKGDDYFLPDTDLTLKQLGWLSLLWHDVEEAIDRFGKQNFIDALPEIIEGDFRLMYVNNYLNDTWLSYGDAIASQGLTTKGGNK